MEIKKFPPLNWLRSFEVSARLLNFTQASVELNMTQAAVSQQISKLENYLGTALFERLPRGLALTDAGMAYVPIVQETTLRLARATEELFGSPRRNKLIVNVNLVFFTEWLAYHIDDFKVKYPHISLQFTSNIYDDGSKRPSDLRIRLGQGQWKGYECHRLADDKIFPVCSPSYFGNTNINDISAALSRASLLHVMGYEDGWGYWLNNMKLDLVDHAKGIQLDTLITAFKLAELGQGVVLARSSLVKRHLKKNILIAPFDPEYALNASEAFHLAIPEENLATKNVLLFKEWLLEKIQE